MDFTVYDIAIVPLIIALVEVFKRFGMPKQTLPPLAIIFGVVAGIVYIAPDDLPQAILVGLVMGLSAVGLFSGVKNSGEFDKDL